MLDVKELISKILNWIATKNSWTGFNYTWNVNTANTTDTWIPVFRNNEIQHRVIPNDAYATATKTNSSAWTGGSIEFFRKGNCCTAKFNGVAHPQITGRTTIGTIPSGFRPPTELEVLMANTNSSGNVSGAIKFLLEYNGEIKIDPTNAGSAWATITYCV